MKIMWIQGGEVEFCYRPTRALATELGISPKTLLAPRAQGGWYTDYGAIIEAELSKVVPVYDLPPIYDPFTKNAKTSVLGKYVV